MIVLHDDDEGMTTGCVGSRGARKERDAECRDAPEKRFAMQCRGWRIDDRSLSVVGRVSRKINFILIFEILSLVRRSYHIARQKSFNLHVATDDWVIDNDPLSSFHLREKHYKSKYTKMPCGNNYFNETMHLKSNFHKVMQMEIRFFRGCIMKRNFWQCVCTTKA